MLLYVSAEPISLKRHPINTVRDVKTYQARWITETSTETAATICVCLHSLCIQYVPHLEFATNRLEMKQRILGGRKVDFNFKKNPLSYDFHPKWSCLKSKIRAMRTLITLSCWKRSLVGEGVDSSARLVSLTLLLNLKIREELTAGGEKLAGLSLPFSWQVNGRYGPNTVQYNDLALWPQWSTWLTDVSGVCTLGMDCVCLVHLQRCFLFSPEFTELIMQSGQILQGPVLP